MFPDSDAPLLVLGQVQEDSPPWASRFPSVGFWRVFKFLYIYICVRHIYIWYIKPVQGNVHFIYEYIRNLERPTSLRVRE